MATLMIDHIDKKREALGIMGERERVLMDMADRQKLDRIPDSF
jgi:carbon-monoxide dehydrogenase catalytic subunit